MPLISLHDFMESALYCPVGGYYTKLESIKQDFITSPELSILFGEIIAFYIINYWQTYFQCENFSLIELGAGDGSLMLRLIKTLNKSEAAGNFKSAIVEISPTLKTKQKDTLKSYTTEWFSTIDEALKHLGSRHNFIVANEFFDALAIEQYVYTKAGWYQAMINTDTKEILFNLLHNDNEDISVIRRYYPHLPSGGLFEFSPLAVKIFKKILATVNSAALIIDYGYFSPPYKSTLQSILRHSSSSDIFANFKERDLTALVNFDLFNKIAQDKAIFVSTQRDFLLSHYIEKRAEIIASKCSDKNALYSNLNRLIDSDKMGELFKVMAIKT